MFDHYDIAQVFTDWRVQGAYHVKGIASAYLPEERVNAYLDAAEQMHCLVVDTLQEHSGGGEFWDTPEVVQYLEDAAELRRIRSQYDLKIGIPHNPVISDASELSLDHGGNTDPTRSGDNGPGRGKSSR